MYRLLFYLIVCLIFICCTDNQKDSPLSTISEDLSCEHISYSDYPNGMTQVKDQQGQVIAEGHLNDGVPEGFWKHYDQNGNIQKEGHYTDGKLNGFWKVYAEDGTSILEGHFSNCEPYGFWKILEEGVGHETIFEGNL